MLKYYLVDVIVFLGSFSGFLLLPLRNEYIYQRVVEKYNYTKPGQSYCGPNETKQGKEDQMVADESSRWTMYMNLALFLPAIIATAIITSWGDRVGRKITMAIPMAGTTLSSVVLGLLIKYHWPLETIIGYSVIAGGSGYLMALVMQGVAYLSDVTDLEKRGVRFTILETFLSIGGGTAGLAGGYWSKAEGFLPSVWFTVGVGGLGFLLIFFLPDSMAIVAARKHENEQISAKEVEDASEDKKSRYQSFEEISNEVANDNEQEASPLWKDEDVYCTLEDKKERSFEVKKEKKKYTFCDLWKSVWRVYTTEYLVCEDCFGENPDIDSIPSNFKCKHGGGVVRGRIWRLWFYLLSYSFFMFVNIGTTIFQTLFFLAYPLCFTAALIGIQQATKYAAAALGPLWVYLLKNRLHLKNELTIFIAQIGFLAPVVIMSFATDPFLVFIATATGSLGNITRPLLQAQISSLASESEQGSAFALLSSCEVLSYLLCTICYLMLYPATLHISHWFTWMFSAAVDLIPILLVGTILVVDRLHRNTESDENKPLLKK